MLHRSSGVTAVATFACAVYTAALLAQGAAFAGRYSSAMAGGLPFGIGALLDYGRGALSPALAPHPRIHVALASSLFAANAIAPALVPRGYAFYWGFYISVAAVAYLVTALSVLDPRRALPGWARPSARNEALRTHPARPSAAALWNAPSETLLLERSGHTLGSRPRRASIADAACPDR